MSILEYIVATSPGHSLDLYTLTTVHHHRTINTAISPTIPPIHIDDTYTLVATTDKHKTHTTCLAIYNRHTGHNVMRCNLAEPIHATAASHDRLFVVLGIGDKGKCTIYELITGNILATFTAHYKRITHTAFTHDNTLLVTTSDDTICNVWRLVDVLQPNAQPQPYYTYNTHSLPITALSIHSIRIYTASQDYTLSVYDMALKRVVKTYKLNCALHCMAVTPDEQYIYTAGTDGNIYKITQSTDTTDTLVGHTTTVTALALSFNCATLVSCSGDNVIQLHDTNSLQSVKQIKRTQRTSTTHVSIIRDPATALGFLDSTQSSVTAHKRVANAQNYVFPPFKRLYNPADLKPDVILVRPYNLTDPYESSQYRQTDDAWQDQLYQTWRELTAEPSSENGSGGKTVQSLTQENNALKAELQKYRAMNQQLYQLASKNVT